VYRGWVGGETVVGAAYCANGHYADIAIRGMMLDMERIPIA
jgi:hypothetical protein